MEASYLISTSPAPFTPCADRLAPRGYREPMGLERQLECARAIAGLAGVSVVWPDQFEDPSVVRPLLEGAGLAASTVEIALHADRRWRLGTFTCPDAGLRREAIDQWKRGIDVAAELGAADALVWPGTDGFDYPFQADYRRNWDLLVEGLREVGGHRADVRLAVEYKPREARAHLHLCSAGVLLSMLQEIDLPNVGATLDLGHSLMAGENPAEAAALLARAGKLFQVHLDDNYRDWDHDLLPGSVNFWETLELFYWVERSGYRGWYLLDLFPSREDGSRALQEGVDRAAWFIDRARALEQAGLARALERADTLAAQRLVWSEVLAEAAPFGARPPGRRT